MLDTVIKTITDIVDTEFLLCRLSDDPDASPVVEWANASAIKKLNASLLQLIGFPLFDLIAPGVDGGEQERVFARLRRAEHTNARVLVKAFGGATFPAWLRSFRTTAPKDGEVLLLVTLDVPTVAEISDGSVQDISENEESDPLKSDKTSKLFEKPEFLAATIAASGIGLWEWYVQSGAVQYSAEWFTMLGYQPGELPPGFDTFEELAHPDDTEDILAKAQSAFAGERDEYESTFRMRCKDGSWKWIKATGQVVNRDGEGKAVRILGTHIDLSQEMAREEALTAALEKAEEATEIKSRFLATMSHEIRTPLTGIMGMLDHALQGDLDTAQREPIEVAMNSSRHLLSILNDTLDYSKLEAGLLTLDLTDFSPIKVAREIASLFKAKADQRGIEIIVDTTSCQDGFLSGDIAKIRQILLNLVGNAIKFTEEGTITIRAQIEAQAEGKSILRYSVVDTGIGIAHDKLKDIFESFSQADTSTTRTYGGTGLGLTISKRLATFLGGDLHVTSTEGQGSKFWFDIPVTTVAAATAVSTDQEIAAPVSGATPLSGHVLLVEDHPINQSVVTRYLGRIGLTFEVASDGLEGVKKASETRFDVILMDAHMPKLDGESATRRIRAEAGPNQSTPIIALTADAMAGAQDRFLEAGFTGYVAKPIDFDLLTETIASSIAQSSTS